MRTVDNKGNSTLWLWDYVNEQPRKDTEMTKEEKAASEKRKYEIIKEQLNNESHENEFGKIAPERM